jgi:type II secretory pathway component HofQ
MTISTLILAAFLSSAQLITIDARDMDLGDFLRFMGTVANMNVVIHPAVQGKVNLTVQEARWGQVLDVVLKTHGLAKEVEGNIMRIVPAATVEAEQRQKAATEQACLNALPLQTRTYILNYAKAANIVPIISKMLSPRGSVIAYPARNAVIVTDIQNAQECSR